MRSVFYFYKMHHFIKNVIEKIFSDKTRNISNSIIILPNKRSKVFLKKEISYVTKKTIFAPKIYDIEEFMSVISGIDKIFKETGFTKRIQSGDFNWKISPYFMIT